MLRPFSALAFAAFFGLLVASTCDASSATTSNVDRVRLPGHTLHVVVAPEADPATHTPDPNERIQLTIVLRRDDEAGFSRYLHELYDPRSPIFRRYLAPSQVADRFGPTLEEYYEVVSYLRANGFDAERVSGNRLTLTVGGTRATAERVFATRIADYEIGGHRFYANLSDPALPPSLARRVQAVIGLHDLSQPRLPAVRAYLHALCAFQTLVCAGVPNNTVATDCNTAADNGQPYNVDISNNCTPLPTGAPEPTVTLHFSARHESGSAAAATPHPWSGLDGTGQTIGLLEFDSFKRSDVQDYLAFVGQPASLIDSLSTIDVNGGTAPGAYETEVLLDVETTLTLAPGAKTVVYSAPFAGIHASFESILNQMIDDGVSIISNSWVYCEDETTPADTHAIDTVLQNAAIAGITVLNATGDEGATCFDGSQSAAVPADSPNATAVGGSSEAGGPAFTYAQETWWDGASSTPPTGQGGFGVSTMFAATAYQTAASGVSFRSVPDVVVNGDPYHGIEVCQADSGGCPTGLLYGGTSYAAPQWAAMVALLNQANGSDLGFLNPLLYPLANTSAFHDAASLGSDFAHVGLGSPNLNELYLQLTHQSAGVPSASSSRIEVSLPLSGDQAPPSGVIADGASKATVVVFLRDANGNSANGKTVTLSANAGSHATIVPSSAMTTIDNGAAFFEVGDTTVEDVTLTAKDTTDDVTLAATTFVSFVTPPATAGGFDAFPTSVTADGKAATTITVTLTDALDRPSPGKQIAISQNGRSVVSGPNPPVTDAAGTVTFSATDFFDETVAYAAFDVTDGVPVPLTNGGSATVTFSSSPGLGCGVGAFGSPTAAPGFAITTVASGFQEADFTAGGVHWGACPGAFGPAFDDDGNIYVSDFVDGNLYKFPPAGGVAGPATLLASIGPALGQPVFSNGNLYVVQSAVSGGQSQILQIDRVTGAILKTVVAPAAGIVCSHYLAADPLSGDLFADNVGCGCDARILRVSGPNTATPQVSTYVNAPGCPNYALSFASDGTLYVEGDGPSAILKISGTNVMHPTVTSLFSPPPYLGGSWPGLGLLSGGAGSGQFLLYNQPSVTAQGNSQTTLVDIATSPPRVAQVFTANSMLGDRHLVRGPGGCFYGAGGTGVFKLTDAAGTCDYASEIGSPELLLDASHTTPNPAQGSPQTFTATFHDVSAPAGTAIRFRVTGANPQLVQVKTDALGTASFTYAGAHAGVDTIAAFSTLDGTQYASNAWTLTWTAGKHATFLSLNTCPEQGIVSRLVTLTANLSDVSGSSPVPVPGQNVTLALGNAQCTGTTGPTGDVSCQVTPDETGILTLTATFAGTAQHAAASQSKGFDVLAPVAVSLGHFLTYGAGPTKGTAKFVKLGPVTLADELGARDFDVLKPTALGVPANKNGEGFADAAIHLEAYDVKQAKGSAKFARRVDLHVTNQCSDLVVTATKPMSLLVPTAEDPNAPVSPPDASLHDVDHFLCYRAKVQKKRSDGTVVPSFAKGIQVDVTDEFATRRYDLTGLSLLCSPVAKTGTPTVLAGPDKGSIVPITPAAIRHPDAHLACYTAKLAKKHIDQHGCGAANASDKGTPITPPQPKPIAHRGLHVANQLGSGEIDAKKPTLLCVPTALVP